MAAPRSASVPRFAPQLAYYFDLVIALTVKEIKVRYKRTVLGYGWSLLNPLVFAVTYWVAFKAILNVKIEGYFIFLLAGLRRTSFIIRYDYFNQKLPTAGYYTVHNYPMPDHLFKFGLSWKFYD